MNFNDFHMRISVFCNLKVFIKCNLKIKPFIFFSNKIKSVLYILCITYFNEDLNEKSEVTCYQEFGSTDIEDIRRLRGIIGKRFYALPCQEDGKEYDIVIEEE